MRHKTEFTYPALLAGLWVFLSMLEAMEAYSQEEPAILILRQIYPVPGLGGGDDQPRSMKSSPVRCAYLLMEVGRCDWPLLCWRGLSSALPSTIN